MSRTLARYLLAERRPAFISGGKVVAMKDETNLPACCRCGTHRDHSLMVYIEGLGYACDDPRTGGTSCAMQLQFRGYKARTA